MRWNEEDEGTGLTPLRRRINGKESPPEPELTPFAMKMKSVANRFATNALKEAAPRKRTGGAAARNKGKKGEQEAARILQAVLDKAFLDAFVLLAEQASPASVKDVLVFAARQKMLMLKATAAGGDNSLRVLRNTMQAARGGCDLVGTPGISVEVKACAREDLKKWSSQTVCQAVRNTVPVLWYKVDRKPWRCRIFVKNICDPNSYADVDYKLATEWLYTFWYEGTKRDVWGMLS